MLPPTIPIFPLPNVVLFPNVFLPLHIFETRYRQMVDAALSGDRIIGMVLLRPGWEGDYEGRPPVYQIGCAGVVTHAERLADGRFNIVLRGMEKFRIADEDTGQIYRVANVVPVPEPPAESVREAMRSERNGWKRCSCLNPRDRSGAHGPLSMADEDRQRPRSIPRVRSVEKQALLERDGLLERCRSLIELLEMKVWRLATRGTRRLALSSELEGYGLWTGREFALPFAF